MWKIFKLARRGRGHIDNQQPCQDKVSERCKNGVCVIALADGAGSAKMSQQGARIVVSKTSEMLTNRFYEFINNKNASDVKKEIVSTLIESLESWLKNRPSRTLKDLASTLLFVAFDEEQFMLGHIGDGVIAYRKNGDFKAISTEEKSGEVNATTFVTSQNAEYSIVLKRGNLVGVDCFVLMSDGAETSLYNKHQDIFAKLLTNLVEIGKKKEARVVEKILKERFEKDIINRTSDDCSLVMAIRTTRKLLRNTKYSP